jgi:hypothetical protein
VDTGFSFVVVVDGVDTRLLRSGRVRPEEENWAGISGNATTGQARLEFVYSFCSTAYNLFEYFFS